MPIDMASYLKQRNDAQKRIEEARQQVIETPNKNNGYQFGKITGTIFDVVSDVGYGFVKGVEGMSDAILGVAANVFKSDSLAEAVAENQTEELVGGINKKMSENSFLNNDSKAADIVHQVGTGIGMMLPSVIITAATKGAFGKEGIATAAGMIAFGAGAGGTAMEEALNEGATKEQALKYGALSGATEVAIEYASAGLGKVAGKLLGKGGAAFGKVMPQVGSGFKEMFSRGAGKAVSGIVVTFLEEGGEEVAGDLLDPLWKSITYKDGGYEAPDSEKLMNSFIVGGVTALAMGGGTKVVDVARYGIDGSKYAGIRAELEELNRSEIELEKQGKLTDEIKEKNNLRRQEIAKQLIELGEKIQNSDKNRNKRVLLEDATLDEATHKFDAKKEVVKESVARLNKRTNSDTKVEFKSSEEINKLLKSNNKEVSENVVNNGFYDKNTNTIYINDSSTDAYSVVAAHEYTHSLENREGYEVLSREVLEYLGEEQVKVEQEKLREIPSYEDMTELEINKEIIANKLSEWFASDSKALSKVYATKPNIIQRLLNWINSKLSKTTDMEEYSELNNIRNRLNEVIDSKSVENTTESSVELSSKTKKYKFNKDSLESEVKDVDTSELRRQINKTLKEVYQYTEHSTLDGVAVQLDNKVYLLDSGKTETGFDYAVYKQEVFEDADLAENYKEDNNNDIRAKEQNEQSNENIEGNGGKFSSNSRVGINIRENRQTSEDFRGKSKSNFEGISRDDGDRGGISQSSKLAPIDNNGNARTTTLKDLQDRVETVAPRQNKTFTEWSQDTIKRIDDLVSYRNELIESFEVQFINSMAGLEKLGDKYISDLDEIKNITDSKLKKEAELKLQRKYRAKINTYRNVEAAANDYLQREWYNKIAKEVYDKGAEYQSEFETYLALRTHIKRVEVYEQYNDYLDILARERKNKTISKAQYTQLKNMLEEEYGDVQRHPVFGDLTAQESRQILKETDDLHPEFKGIASKVYGYLNTLQEMRIKNGLINKTQAKFMKDYYSENGENWYVPTYRAEDINSNGAVFAYAKTLGVNRGIRAAKGGNSNIQGVFKSIAQQTMGVHKQIKMNELFNWAKSHTPEGTFVQAETSTQTRSDIDGDIRAKNPNEVYFYVDGEKITYKVPANVAAAFNSMRNTTTDLENTVVLRGAQKAVATLKKFTTELNPFFAIRNLFRDASDAFIYTKYSTNLLKRYNRALKEIRGKGKYFEVYKSMGGDNMSFFDHDYGLNLVQKNGLAQKITILNETIEMMPRLSEFIESLDNSVKEYNESHEEKITIDDVLDSTKEEFLEMRELAMFDANEVTVNFGRSGTVTRKLNRYLMPYLNASVQGFAKTLGTFVHPKSLRAWSGAMIKTVLAALPAVVLNEIMLGDDDDYKELSDDVKAGYFLIPVGNHKFIRIPRGRVEMIVGDAMQRLIRAEKNDMTLDEAFDGYFNTTLKNITPVDNLSRTIFSPITDVKTNSTWYGGQIENSSMQKLPINERYDENTSEIAKWLSSATGSKMSPKKWNYLLDQYSGVLGDVVLPLTSSNKSKLINNTGFVSDSLSNSNTSDKYYDVYDKLQQANNSSKSTAVDKARLKYFNKMNNKVIELNKARKSTTDKDEQDALKLLTIQTQRTTLEGLNEFTKTLEKYSQYLEYDELYDEYYREATRECFGAEIALKDYNSKVYEKASAFNKLGIDWETFYNIYFDAKDFEADYDINGNVISGSKKAKVTKYVKSLKLNATQKYMVMGLLGYKNANGKAQVRSALIRAGYTGDALKEMLELCGYDD